MMLLLHHYLLFLQYQRHQCIILHQNTTRYNYWTDAAINIYGDSTLITMPPQTKKRRIVRPSSTIKVAPPRHQDSVLPTTVFASAPTQPASKHVYQFSTYDGQHSAYWKYLLDMDMNSGLLTASTTRPIDDKGRCRVQKQQLRANIDTFIKQSLWSHAPYHWTTYIDQAIALTSLCDSISTASAKQIEPIAQHGSMGLGTSSYPIGTGIDHFSLTHRLQRRQQRALCFVQRRKSQRAPEFWPLDFHTSHHAHLLHKHIAHVQHNAYLPNSHTSCAPTLRLHRRGVVLDDLLHETAIAPVVFRQHQVSDTLWDVLYKDGTPSSDVENAPLHFGPHNLWKSFINSHFVSATTHPDGPSNVLLYDILHANSSEHMGNSSSVSSGISTSFYSPHVLLTFSGSELTRHMGNLMSTYFGISSPYFSPHAYVPFANRFGQDMQKRPQQESNPQDRPNLLSFGPGDFSTHIHQRQPQYFPSGPGATDYHKYQEAERRATRCIALHYLYWLSEPPHDDPLISFSHGTFDSISVFRCALTEPSRAVPRPAESSIWYNATIWQEALLLGAHTDTPSALDSPARDRLTSWSKTSTCGQAQDRPFVQRFPERDSSSLSLPSLPSPSFSFYPPQSKFDLDQNPPHLTSYGISYSQMQALLSLHRLTFCHLFSDSLDWLTQLVTPNDTHEIFFHNSHWYVYSQDRHRVHVLLKNSNDPLRTFLTELTYLDSPFHTLSFCFYYAPPTPRGLCGLVAISSLCYLLGRQTPLPVLQLSGYTLHWRHSKAVRELHIHYASIVANTSKHFFCGPIGFMDNENPVDSRNDLFTVTDTMSPQVPSLHPDTFSIPLIPPNFSHEPITYNLHLTDSELADFLDIQTVVDQRFVYFHLDQSLSMSYFHLKDTTTPPQLFSVQWNELYPCYPQSCIKKILLWDTFLQTWNPTDFTQIDRLPQTSHLRIHFHTRWLHVDFPLIKRSFRIEITPLWTVQHVIESLQTTLGHSSTSLILTQQGRTLPQYFDPWRALPSYTLKPLPAKIPPTLSIHQGRQLAKPLRYCTCNTLCATTHELTKRTVTSFGNPQINVCIFRHPVNNNLFVLPICSITTPTHIHARFLPYNAVFWIPVVNDTFVSMDSILIHYGTPVALEFYELPLTRGIHTDTLYGTSLFHLRIQDPGTMTYRPYKRIVLQPNPHLHRFVDIALIIEPTLTVEELELTLENFLRLNLDCLQPPRNQPVGTLVRNTVQQTYQVLVGEDPYAIRHNLYNPLFPKMATRPYPPNHDYWTISDQFCSFLQSVPKTPETTFRDVFYDHFRYDHFDYTSIRSIVFNNETWHLYDFVPITSCDRIVYVLSPIRLDTLVGSQHTCVPHCFSSDTNFPSQAIIGNLYAYLQTS